MFTPSNLYIYKKKPTKQVKDGPIRYKFHNVSMVQINSNEPSIENFIDLEEPIPVLGLSLLIQHSVALETLLVLLSHQLF